MITWDGRSRSGTCVPARISQYRHPRIMGCRATGGTCMPEGELARSSRANASESVVGGGRSSGAAVCTSGRGCRGRSEPPSSLSTEDRAQLMAPELGQQPQHQQHEDGQCGDGGGSPPALRPAFGAAWGAPGRGGPGPAGSMRCRSAGMSSPPSCSTPARPSKHLVDRSADRAHCSATSSSGAGRPRSGGVRGPGPASGGTCRSRLEVGADLVRFAEVRDGVLLCLTAADGHSYGAGHRPLTRPHGRAAPARRPYGPAAGECSRSTSTTTSGAVMLANAVTRSVT